MNQWINESINRSMNQSMNEWNNEWMNQSINQWINQSMWTNGIRPLRHNNIWGGRFSTSASSSPGNRTESWLNLNRRGRRGLISRLHALEHATQIIMNSESHWWAGGTCDGIAWAMKKRRRLITVLNFRGRKLPVVVERVVPAYLKTRIFKTPWHILSPLPPLPVSTPNTGELKDKPVALRRHSTDGSASLLPCISAHLYKSGLITYTTTHICYRQKPSLSRDLGAI